MLNRLKLNKEQKEHVFDFINIYNLRLEGWNELANHCCFKEKKNAKPIFKSILQFINWEKVHDFHRQNSLGVDQKKYLIPFLIIILEIEWLLGMFLIICK